MEKKRIKRKITYNARIATITQVSVLPTGIDRIGISIIITIIGNKSVSLSMNIEGRDFEIFTPSFFLRKKLFATSPALIGII